MGKDKARIAFPGSDPMALTVARALSVLGPVGIVRHLADDWPLPVVVDGAEDRHPLWGIAAALRHASAPMVMVAPCDLPWLTGEEVRRIFANAPAVAVAEGRTHPLLAAIPASDADRAANLARDGAPASALVAGFTRVEVDAAAVREVNRWADTGRALGPVAALLARLPAVNRDRVAAGEVTRLRARGAVDPTWPD